MLGSTLGVLNDDEDLHGDVGSLAVGLQGCLFRYQAVKVDSE